MAEVKKSTVTVTIPAGQSVSNSADLTAGSLALVISPQVWDPANISFLVSDDNTNFVDLFDADGAEAIKAMAPGRGILVATALTQAAMYLKIRSGPRANPVIQSAARIFKLVIV
jgi:hypothetical protein